MVARRFYPLDLRLRDSPTRDAFAAFGLSSTSGNTSEPMRPVSHHVCKWMTRSDPVKLHVLCLVGRDQMAYRPMQSSLEAVRWLRTVLEVQKWLQSTMHG